MVRSNDWLTAGQRYPSVGRRGHRGRPKCGSTGLQNPCQGRRHVTYQLHKRHFEHLSMSNVPPQTVWNATKHWLLPLCFALKIKMLLRSVVCVQHKKKKVKKLFLTLLSTPSNFRKMNEIRSARGTWCNNWNRILAALNGSTAKRGAGGCRENQGNARRQRAEQVHAASTPMHKLFSGHTRIRSPKWKQGHLGPQLLPH